MSNSVHENYNSDLQTIDVVRQKGLAEAKSPDDHERLKQRVTAKLAYRYG